MRFIPCIAAARTALQPPEGKNPSQVGYGSSIASIDLNMTSSTYTPGRPMDCMLYGDGFFLVGSKDAAGVIDAKDPNTFKSLTLTRVGDFEFKADGYLTDGKGQPGRSAS